MKTLIVLSVAFAHVAKAAYQGNHFMVLFADEKSPSRVCRYEGKSAACGFRQEDKCSQDNYTVRVLLGKNGPYQWGDQAWAFEMSIPRIFDYVVDHRTGKERGWSPAFDFNCDFGPKCTDEPYYKAMCCRDLKDNKVDVGVVNSFEVLEGRKTVRRVPIPESAVNWMIANQKMIPYPFNYPDEEWDTRYPKDLTVPRFGDLY